MLHKLLEKYLNAIEKALLGIENGYVERYQEEILHPERANLRIRVRFANGNFLEMNEAVIVENNQLVHLDYRYHCQNEENQMIFRYDSTPHFPELPTFPHHKHLPDEVIASVKPDITQVLQEAINLPE